MKFSEIAAIAAIASVQASDANQTSELEAMIDEAFDHADMLSAIDEAFDHVDRHSATQLNDRQCSNWHYSNGNRRASCSATGVTCNKSYGQWSCDYAIVKEPYELENRSSQPEHELTPAEPLDLYMWKTVNNTRTRTNKNDDTVTQTRACSSCAWGNQTTSSPQKEHDLAPAEASDLWHCYTRDGEEYCYHSPQPEQELVAAEPLDLYMWKTVKNTRTRTNKNDDTVTQTRASSTGAWGNQTTSSPQKEHDLAPVTKPLDLTHCKWNSAGTVYACDNGNTWTQGSGWNSAIVIGAGSLLAIGAGFVIKNKFYAVTKNSVTESLL